MPRKGYSDFKDLNVLVTGGCRGIGLELANCLAALGANIYVTSRDPSSCEVPDAFHVLKFDGSTKSSLDSFAVLLEAIQVDILINNAGAAALSEFSQSPEEKILSELQLLLITPIILTRKLLPQMQTKGHGAIVNISSVASRLPLPYMTPYNTSKAGLSHFSQSLMLELEETAVQVIDFQPGDFRTTFNATAGSEELPDQSPQRRTWDTMKQHMAAAPHPNVAAVDLIKALKSGKSKTMTSGSWFQTKLAILASRLFPGRTMRAMIARYYNLHRK